MRIIEFCANEYYHVFNRGNNKQVIFRDDSDRFRFLFALLFFQAPISYDQIGRYIVFLKRHRTDISQNDSLKDLAEHVLGKRSIELINFCLMPNHFHLAVKPMKDNAVSLYLHKVLTSYTKYWNKKYKATGHLFEGSFKAVRVADNDQFLYLSTYIHRNPAELSTWIGREHEYPWSSLQDYLGVNRWGKLLATENILEQFDSIEEYRAYVNDSTAKTGDDDIEFVQS
ncbi:MAG: transposase [Candidatus Paceibacterota bacterium]|jgi:putative transposase